MKYLASIASWPKEDMDAASAKTQKPLTRHVDFHMKTNIQRLYTSQGEGKWGLVSAKTNVLDETQNIQEYNSMITPTDELLREYLRQQQTEIEVQLQQVPQQKKALCGM